MHVTTKINNRLGTRKSNQYKTCTLNIRTKRCLFLRQQSHNNMVAIYSSPVEWRALVSVLDVDTRASFQQAVDHSDAAVFAGKIDGGLQQTVRQQKKWTGKTWLAWSASSRFAR